MIVIVIMVVIIGVNSVVWKNVCVCVSGELSSSVLFSDIVIDSGIVIVMKYMVWLSVV